ncbi:MAG: isovaleryl-CoA dehydrogenase [Bdellovibrionaceae bacterium]|nr:isovaleryl-CoA dehydrogenase [Pseudobdellovibrionaceae bacterium]
MSFTKIDLFQPTEEHKLLRKMLQQFVKEKVEPQAAAFDKKEEFNLPLFRSLGDLGLLGLTVSEEFGGSNMDAVSAVIAHEELSYSDPGFCLAYLAHSMLCVHNIYKNASNEQKKIYLPKLCSGEWVGAMAMSEPHVGTDILGLKTQAKNKGDHYIINGRKMWITNGTIDEKGTLADVVLLYSQTESKDNKAQLSTFILNPQCKGFSVGQKIQDKMGMRASNTAELVLDQCVAPLDTLMGTEGSSIIHMMRNLELERLTLAAMSLGIAKRCLDIMNRYAKEREAFGKSLSHFGQIQKYIADSFAEYWACRSYVYNVARQLDFNSQGQRLHSDGVKLVTSTMAKKVADRAIQVLGGYGYVSEYHVERLYRDAKLLEIGGGTIEAHQKNITKDLARSL